MSSLDKVNEFCFSLLHDFMIKEVKLYRNKLGFHFAFDFKYMLFVRSSNENQIKLYGPGIRVRDNLFDMHLYSIYINDYLTIKNDIYEKNKEEIKKCIREFDSSEYNLLLDETDKNEMNIDLSKYYQIYVIKNQDQIINEFEQRFN